MSLFRINVRPSVQDKCHLVRLPWYQLLTSWAQPEVAALEGPQRPGISLRWPLWIPKSRSIALSDMPLRLAF